MHILSPYHLELPLHSRTLLQTITSTTIYKLETGEFCYLGLINALKIILSQKDTQGCLKPGEVLKICFNIDGIPLFKSNKLQLWPILGLIKNSSTANVLYYLILTMIITSFLCQSYIILINM